MGFAAPPNIDCALFRWHIVRPLEAWYSDLPRSLLVLPPPEKCGEDRVMPSDAGRGGRRLILAIHPRKAGDVGLVSPEVDDAYLA